MSHRVEELKKYKNQKLMNEFNQMMIRIKLHLFDDVVDPADFISHPEPSVKELDDITNKIMEVLKKDNEPMIKH